MGHLFLPALGGSCLTCTNLGRIAFKDDPIHEEEEMALPMTEYSVSLDMEMEGITQDLFEDLLDHEELKGRGAAGFWQEGRLDIRFDIEAPNPLDAGVLAYVRVSRALRGHDVKLRAVEAQPVEDLEKKVNEPTPETKLLHFLQTGEMPPEWLAQVERIAKDDTGDQAVP